MHQQFKHHLIQLLSLLLCSWGFNLKITPVAAQSITPAADGTGTIINHNGNTYNINGGTQAGANLFHSFTEFGLSTDEVANFLSNPQINNILGRVTGGNASVIQGLIQVTGGNSNLYLMNPNGWVFNQGASIDVPGSFGVTTATRMGFGNGFFNADGANVYSNLTGNPTSLIFDQDNPSWIINEADLEVNSGASLWAVGGGIVSTGTITGGEVTLAAVPGKSQVRLSHEGMVLNLVLDAAPAGGNNHTVTGIQSVDIPRYLTGGSEEGHVNYAVINADGTVNLVNRDTVIKDGDTVIAGEVNADEITLMAAGRVKPTDYDLLSTNPIVVLFPEEIGDNLETTFIDEGINDYQGEDAYQAFLYGGKQGTISQVVTHEEGEGIGTVTRMLAAIAQQGGKVSAIHLLTEGNEGNFWLGRDYVDSENIGEYQQELQQWGVALTAGADILLYSCFTALGVTGEQLITALAQYTGADVAASTDLTGSEALGGNWVFEVTTGEIEAGLGFEQQVLADFTGKLQVFTAGNDADLITAINNANGNNEADTINLTGDITLTGVDNNTDGLNGLPSIAADGGNKLTIDGMGFTIARDAGAMTPNFRILHIAGGAELDLNNTTLSNGVAARAGIRGSGGGIFNRGTLTLNNSTVSGNTANTRGGGIFNYGNGANGATVTLNNNSTVSGNMAVFGGGIFNRGDTANAATVTLNNSTVSGNTADARGGGIVNRGNVENAATLTLNNSTVADNTVTIYDGGGIVNRGDGLNAATVTLNNSTVSGNTANRDGGGILNDGRNGLNAATVNLSDSTVSGNTATYGSGIFNTGYNGADSATVTLDNSTVSGNMAAFGGGIYNYGDGADSAIVTLSNSTVSGNTAIVNGGGIFNYGYYGANAAQVNLNNSTVSGNTAYYGGGIFNYGIAANGATLTLSNSTVSGNTAYSLGGGIANYGNGANNAATLTLSNSTVSGNTAYYGGGIDNFGLMAENAATLTLSNSTVSGNSATYGGGIFNYGDRLNAATVAVGNSIVADNTATNSEPDVGRNDPNNAPITDNGNNLIGIDTTGVFTTSTLVGNLANPLDPQLTPLGDYGGTTQTHALTPNSPALDGGNNALTAGLNTDQRGATRIINGKVDIGAFEAQGFTLNAVVGNGQSTTVNTSFATDLQVLLTEEFINAPLPDATINFTSPGTGASANFGNSTPTTDANGIATATTTANTIAGTYQVAATATGLNTVNFELTNNPGAAAFLSILAGSNQSTTVNTAFANSLQVQVTDEFSNVVPGVTVNLTTPSTGAGVSLGSLFVTTDASGIATVTANANIVAGDYLLEANVTGVTGVNFELTNNPGAAALLNILAGNNQSTTVNTAFANSLQVQVTDEFGNVVPGVTVNLTTPSTGAGVSLGNISSTTDASGIATATVAANTIAGNYQVEANVTGATGINFELTNNPGAAAALSIFGGNNQTTIISTPFTNSLQVKVTDEFGNVVPGVTVTLTAPVGIGASASFGSISLTTDASGLASTTAMANTIAGDYLVGASVIGVTEVNFNLTNTALDLIPIWESISDELPEYGLEESACQTTPAVVINSTVEEITLDEEIETEIQRNQDCQPVGIEN